MTTDFQRQQVAELREDFEEKFLERFGSEPAPLSPLKRRVISAWVQDWALRAIKKANDDGRST